MNVNTVKPQPTDRVELVGYALEQSGHLWAVEQMLVGYTTLTETHEFTALVRRVYNAIYRWNVGGFTLSEVRTWVFSKVKRGTPDQSIFKHPQQDSDPSFVVAAKRAVVDEVATHLIYDAPRAIQRRLKDRGIEIDIHEAHRLWNAHPNSY